MVLRFHQMLAGYPEAKNAINRACRDLSRDSIEKFGTLTRQFYIMNNLDIFIDDDMPNEEYGYILKVLRSIGFIQENATVVVPSSHMIDASKTTEMHDADMPDSEEDNIISIDDLLPLQAFDDGKFEEEYEEALNLPDDDDE